MKKKILLLLFCLVALIAKAEIASGTCGTNGDNITWCISDDSIMTFSGKGDIATYNVTVSSGDSRPWLKYRNSVKELVIEEGITSIPILTFYRFTKLTKVSLPESMVSIDASAFYLCNSLPDVDGMIYVGNLLVSVKDKTLASYSIKDNTTIIGYSSFSNCSNLKSVNIPNSVVTIGGSAFYGCNQLESVKMSNSIQYIGEYAFQECSRLSSIDVPMSINKIEPSAFMGCKSLSVTDNAIYVGPLLVSVTNESLESFTIKSGTKFIGTNAFYGNALSSVDIPETVLSVGTYAFSQCKNLSCITLPNSISDIGESVFWGCTGLKEVHLPDSLTEINSDLFSECKNLSSIVLPNSIISIKSGAFRNCTNLQSIELPATLTSIGWEAFCGCANLKSIYINSDILSTGSRAFKDCSSLSVYVKDLYSWCNVAFDSYYTDFFSNPITLNHQLFVNNELLQDNLVIPNGIRELKDGAFYNYNKFYTLTFPNTLENIGNYCFYGCSDIREIRCQNPLPATVHSYSFDGIKTANCKLYVPFGSKDAYAFAEGWGDFVNIIEEESVNPDVNIEKPTISYENKKLKFASSTPNVKFIYTINAEDATPLLTEIPGDELELSATYKIIAYAKTDSLTSEASYATLVWLSGELSPDETDVKSINVDSTPLLITQNDGNLTISGLDDGEVINAYTVKGVKVDSSAVSNGSACLNLAALRGDVVVLSVGGKTCKVMVK